MVVLSGYPGKPIIEKQLGITGDYQYKALRSSNFLQANWHQNKLTILTKLLDAYKPKTILDLGTGSGNFELAFAKKLTKIVGVDYYNEALVFLSKELKKRKIKNVKLVKEDILNVRKITKLGKFDAIIMVDVIEHLKAKPAFKLIASFKKVLNPDGKIIIITPNYKSAWQIIENLLDRFTGIPHLENMQHILKFDPVSLRNTFLKYKYAPLAHYTFNTISFLAPNKELSSALCNFETSFPFPYGSLLAYVFKL